MHLLDLPEELLERIGALLDRRDVLVFGRVSAVSRGRGRREVGLAKAVLDAVGDAVNRGSHKASHRRRTMVRMQQRVGRCIISGVSNTDAIVSLLSQVDVWCLSHGKGRVRHTRVYALVPGWTDMARLST